MNNQCICVMENARIEKDEVLGFFTFLATEAGIEQPIIILENVQTKIKSRIDVLFRIHSSDVIAIQQHKRRLGIRWWNEVFCSADKDIYPNDIIKKYPVIQV